MVPGQSPSPEIFTSVAAGYFFGFGYTILSQSTQRPWVAAQHLDVKRIAVNFAEYSLDIVIVPVTLEIDEKYIGPHTRF